MLKINVHDIGVEWKQCSHCHCKAKENGHLATHKANVHNIGVQWKECAHCEYKTKETGSLNKHTTPRRPSESEQRGKDRGVT